MLTLHVIVSILGLLVGAAVLSALCRGTHQPTGAAVLIVSSVIISLTGFALPSPPGTPTPDPARIVGVIELVAVAIAAVALYGLHLARIWRGVYVLAIVLTVYLNAFVAVVQAFLKIGFLHELAPTGKEPPFLVAQVLTLALFALIGITGLRRFRRNASGVVATAG